MLGQQAPGLKTESVGSASCGVIRSSKSGVGEDSIKRVLAANHRLPRINANNRIVRQGRKHGSSQLLVVKVEKQVAVRSLGLRLDVAANQEVSSEEKQQKETRRRRGSAGATQAVRVKEVR